jgi:hypothetical protein
MDETRLGHVTVRVRVPAIFFGMTSMVTEGTTLQQLATMRQVTPLVTPPTAIRDPPVIGDPGLSDKPFAL